MNVLLVGATSAVAQQFAAIMARRGGRLYCIARSTEKLATLQAELGEVIAGIEACDLAELTESESGSARAEAMIEAAFTTLGSIEVVLFAQGLLPHQSETETQLSALTEAFRVNTLSVIALLNPLHARLRAQNTSSKVAVITSVAGDRGRPRNFTYGAAKGGLGLYIQGLRSKYWGSSVELYNVRLGPTDTPMTVDHEKNKTFISAERAAMLIDRGLQRRRYELYVPGFWRWVMLAVRLMPEWVFQRLKFLSAP